ncbi:MAG: hypothetical protein Q7R99_02650 [bacterium]|nr:hypothetical protein [bacterium]
MEQQPSPKGIKPFWPIVLLVLVVALVGVLVWQKNNANQTVDVLQDIVLLTQKVLSGGCVKEGEKGMVWISGLEQNSGKKNDICCKGLTGIDDVSPNPFDGGCMGPISGGLGGSFVCAACGNGVCGTGENQCNCSADCK